MQSKIFIFFVSEISGWGNPDEMRQGNGLEDRMAAGSWDMAQGEGKPLPFKKLSKNPLGRA